MLQIGSCDCTKTELDLKSIPSNMTTMQDAQWIDYHLIASLDSYHAPIEFTIPPIYTDLSQTYLYAKFRILKETGEDRDADSKVYPVNSLFQSMFSGIDLYLNNKLVTKDSDTYPYKAYIENLFSYGSDVKEKQLKAAEFGMKMNLQNSKTSQTDQSQLVVPVWGEVKLWNCRIDYIWISQCKKNIYPME